MGIYTERDGEIATLDETVSTLTEASTQIPAGELGAAFGKMILSLAILIILLLASYWLIKKIIQQRLEKGANDSAIQIIEKRMLSPKTMLYLVQIDQKKVLLAESQLEIKRLDTIPLPVEGP